MPFLHSILKNSIRAIAVFSLLASALSCTPNDPYRPSERGQNIFYTTFNEPPKHFDPAKAYSSDEYEFIAQVYEPLLQYHYLKRPYILAPLTAEAVPEPVYNADKILGKAAVYEIKIKKGIFYAPHPAFAKDEAGRPLYSKLTSKDLKDINEIGGFNKTGARELRADDYIYQMMRLADPELQSPIYAVLEKYILGMDEFTASLRLDLEAERKKRKEAAGASYNQETDERDNPIILDYKTHPFKGAVKTGEYSLRIILKTKYPQFSYWLAMPFFSPIPEEADLFYKQGALVAKNITLDRFPVGTGPYMMERYNPNMEITLSRNPNYHNEAYPSEGEEDDEKNGYLRDKGKPLPFIEKLVFKLEKEALPRWNKFLQGYYDNSGIAAESFDQAVSFASSGKAEPTDSMKKQGIRLITSVRPSSYYAGFNMLDPIVGGYGRDKEKLRQAVSIAIDYEEYIDIFNNGRGVPAMSPLPPGIFGRVEGEAGINKFVYEWDADRERPARRSIDYAKKLLSEAGYPNGVGKDGKPLVITFDNAWTGADSAPMINWFIKRFKLLGIELDNRTTDYNRFQEKMMKGNFQFFSWGWNADYPDPENFMFLLTTSNGKVKHQGENVSNYSNAEFDRLFKEMENMENSGERLAIIRKMTAIAQNDAPLVWGFHPVSYGLFHRWLTNVKPNAMANNDIKYHRIDPALRAASRGEWNALPKSVIAAFVVLIIAAIFALLKLRKTANR